MSFNKSRINDLKDDIRYNESRNKADIQEFQKEIPKKETANTFLFSVESMAIEAIVEKCKSLGKSLSEVHVYNDEAFEKKSQIDRRTRKNAENQALINYYEASNET